MRRRRVRRPASPCGPAASNSARLARADRCGYAAGSSISAPTGRILLDTPDADRACALLDGQVEQRDGQQLLVRYANPAELNSRLVGAGLRVQAIRPHRRTLEEVVLSVTGTGSDHIGGPA